MVSNEQQNDVVDHGVVDVEVYAVDNDIDDDIDKKRRCLITS